MKDNEMRIAAKEFATYWKDKGYEKGESQPFWLSLLRDVLGVESPEKYITFEEQVRIDHTSFIDGYISATHVLIEQKGRDKDLRKAIRQSDGSLLTPFQQAQPQPFSSAQQEYQTSAVPESLYQQGASTV